MTERRAILKPCHMAGTASVEGAVVLLDGPDGVAVAMTAEAAELTAASLLQAAAQARREGAAGSGTGQTIGRDGN